MLYLQHRSGSQMFQKIVSETNFSAFGKLYKKSFRTQLGQNTRHDKLKEGIRWKGQLLAEEQG